MRFSAFAGSAGPARVLFIGAWLWSAPAIGSTAQASTAKASAQGPAGHVPGRLLVRFKHSAAAEKQDEILGSLGSTRRGRIPHIDVQLIELPAGADETASAHALRGLPEVQFAELDRLVPQASITPNDPYFPNQQTTLTQIHVPGAWSMTTGIATVTIAILDGGVDGTHPDLAANMVPGWNFVDSNSNTQDVTGHGTLSAGVAAAVGNNGIGIAGISWHSKIMPIRCGSTLGVANVSDVSNGLVWAADHGARVANVGYNLGDTTNSAISTAAQYFQSRGGVVTSAAGNDGQYVACPNDPYILTVSGITYLNAIASMSNTGTNVDLCAPWQIWGTTPSGSYSMYSGTSYSSAAVAGVAALARSANPSLTGVQLRDILTQSVDDLGSSGWDAGFGWGRLNAERAVTIALGGGGGGPPPGDTEPPSVQITSPLNQDQVSGRTSIRASATDNVGVTRVEFYIDGVLKSTDTSSPYRYTWSTNNAGLGPHTLLCKAYDAAGNFGSSPTVTVYR